MLKKSFFLFALIIVSLIFSCGILDQEETTGAIMITTVSENASQKALNPTETLQSVRCIVKKGKSEKFNDYLTDTGTSFYGNIKDLPKGDDYSVILYGKNTNNDIIARGYESGVEVNADEITEVKIIWRYYTATLISPHHGETVNSITPDFIWERVSGATIYELIVSQSSSFFDPVLNETYLSDSSYANMTPFPDRGYIDDYYRFPDRYFWKIRAKDSDGNWGGWSDIWDFSVDTRPILTSPYSDALSTYNKPTFNWVAINEAVFYELVVDNTSGFLSPEIQDSSLTLSNYTSPVSLAVNSIYYWRVRYKDNQGNWGAWSNTSSFTIIETVTDIDGNTYKTIQIGNQRWMAENLKVTRYRNGTAIPTVTSNTDWFNLTTGAYCNYDNSTSDAAIYGRLYNWYAVNDSRNIAPTGWHVPSDEEWKTLEKYLGMSQSEADDTGWRGTNEGVN